MFYRIVDVKKGSSECDRVASKVRLYRTEMAQSPPQEKKGHLDGKGISKSALLCRIASGYQVLAVTVQLVRVLDVLSSPLVHR
jgi:hypothetical protein